MNDIIARRTMNATYPILDLIFIFLLAVLLYHQKKHRALVWGLAGGLLYFVVDFGIFHLLLHSRSISEGTSMFWVLLWMSLSYGFTNFVLIWIWFERDKNFWSYAALIFLWWVACPMISDTFVNAPIFWIQRTTGQYHGLMGLILFVSYAVVLVYNMSVKKEHQLRVFWMLAIGILVQFMWEFTLLIGGIRSDGLSAFDSIKTLIVNSLVETNLGIPLMYAIFKFVTNRHEENLSLSPNIFAQDSPPRTDAE